jgi:hypothetical protein
LTHDFIKANVSSFLKIERKSPHLYRIVASPREKHVGNYSATITLTDDHKYPLSNIYMLEVEILPSADPKPPVKPVRIDLKIITKIIENKYLKRETLNYLCDSRR